nr:hypothetical protein [uncultured Desulfobacter sp.]
MKLNHALHIVRLDIHQCINAVMDFCIGGIDIINNVGVLEQCIDPALEHLIENNISAQRPVPGVEHRDPVAQPAVKIIGPGIQHLKHLGRLAQAFQKALVNGGAHRADFIFKHPFILLFGEQFPFKFIVFDQFVQNSTPLFFGDDQKGIIMAQTGDLNKFGFRALKVNLGLIRPRLCFGGITVNILDQFFKGRQTHQRGFRPLKLLHIQTPYHFVAQSLFGIGILFKFFQKII